MAELIAVSPRLVDRREFLRKTRDGALAVGATALASNIPLGNDSFGRASAAEPNSVMAATKRPSPLDEKITTVDEAIGFAVRHQLIAKENVDSGLKEKFKWLEGNVPFKEGSRAYAPELFVKRLYNLKQDGILDNNGLTVFLKFHDPGLAYGAANKLRSFCRDNLEKSFIKQEADTDVQLFKKRMQSVALTKS